MNRWVVGSTVALGLIAGACVFPEAEKIGGGGAGAGVSNGGAGGAGGGSTSGGGGTGGAGGALEEVVTIADVGAVSCVSGTSTQRHLIRTANGDYLALFFDEASPQDISVKRSDDGMRSWEDVDKLGLAPKLHDTQGANVGFDYASLPDGGVIHAAISVRDADGYYFELHGRATIDETGLPSWEAPQQMGSYALPVTDPPDGPATGITAAGVFDQTESDTSFGRLFQPRQRDRCKLLVHATIADCVIGDPCRPLPYGRRSPGLAGSLVQRASIGYEVLDRRARPQGGGGRASAVVRTRSGRVGRKVRSRRLHPRKWIQGNRPAGGGDTLGPLRPVPPSVGVTTRWVRVPTRRMVNRHWHFLPVAPVSLRTRACRTSGCARSR